MRHKIGDIYLRKGETYIKTDHGTKSYHRYLVEQFLGFKIPTGFTVHHINYNHLDNRLENLCLIPTKLHVWIHRVKGGIDLLESNLPKIKDNPSIIGVT